MSARGHALGEHVLVAAEAFGEHHCSVIGRLGDEAVDQIAYWNRVAFLQAKLCRGLGRGRNGHRQTLVHSQATLFDRLECHVERHRLGKRGRIAQFVGIGFVQHSAGLRVDDQGGIGPLFHPGHHVCRIDGGVDLIAGLGQRTPDRR